MRQKRLEKQRLLIFICLKSLNEENSTAAKLSSLNDELDAEFEFCTEFGYIIKDEISRVRKELQPKQKESLRTKENLPKNTNNYIWKLIMTEFNKIIRIIILITNIQLLIRIQIMPEQSLISRQKLRNLIKKLMNFNHKFLFIFFIYLWFYIHFFGYFMLIPRLNIK